MSTAPKPFRFTARMFGGPLSLHSLPDEAAEMANAKLDAHLATLPRAYLNKERATGLWLGGEHPSKIDTHTALLWGIEPVPVRQCAHTVVIVTTDGSYAPLTGECRNCGARLKVKSWEAE